MSVPDGVREHAVEAVGPGGRPLRRPPHAAGRRLANPGVPCAGLNGGDRAAGRGQALPGRTHQGFQRGHTPVLVLTQARFRVAADIQEEPPHQEGGDRRAERLAQGGGLPLEGFGEGRPAVRRGAKR
jgi:hypothetical protein